MPRPFPKNAAAPLYNALLKGFGAAEAAFSRTAAHVEQQQAVVAKLRYEQRSHEDGTRALRAENDSLCARCVALIEALDNAHDSPSGAAVSVDDTVRGSDDIAALCGADEDDHEAHDHDGEVSGAADGGDDDGSVAESDHSAEQRCDRLVAAASTLDSSFGAGASGVRFPSSRNDQDAGAAAADEGPVRDDDVLDDATSGSSTAPFIPPSRSAPAGARHLGGGDTIACGAPDESPSA